MSEAGRSAPRVGVRELRQNLSVYLRRVKAGESLEVTEHGHVVARLGPPAAPDRSRWDQLLDEAVLRPPRGDFTALGRPPGQRHPPGPSTLSDTLREMRDEDRG